MVANLESRVPRKILTGMVETEESLGNQAPVKRIMIRIGMVVVEKLEARVESPARVERATVVGENCTGIEGTTFYGRYMILCPGEDI